MAGVAALVVAAGRGSRFGGELPKQYADLGGRPLLRHSLEAFARNPGIDAVTSTPFESRTRASLRCPELGFFGSPTQIRRTTPLFCGDPWRARSGFLGRFLRPFRTS